MTVILYTPPRLKEPHSDYIVRILRQNIIACQLIPGSMISEHYLKDIFNVSRSPIREALITLNKEELVDIRPQQGTYISKIKISWVKNFLFMRHIIEVAVLQEVCSCFPQEYLLRLKTNVYHQEQILEFTPQLFLQLDNEFHEIIYSAVNKQDVWKSLESLSTAYDRLTYLLLLQEPKFYSIFVNHHRQTLDILESNNPDKVHQVIDSHTGSMFPRLIDTINKYPDYIC